jgi:hypothetical protein
VILLSVFFVLLPFTMFLFYCHSQCFCFIAIHNVFVLLSFTMFLFYCHSRCFCFIVIHNVFELANSNSSSSVTMQNQTRVHMKFFSQWLWHSKRLTFPCKSLCIVCSSVTYSWVIWEVLTIYNQEKIRLRSFPIRCRLCQREYYTATNEDISAVLLQTQLFKNNMEIYIPA